MATAASRAAIFPRMECEVAAPMVLPGERRQIVAFGGGGFSMERGNPLLDDYVLSLTGQRRPAGLLPARRPAATPTTTSSASTASSPGPRRGSHLSPVPAATAAMSDVREHLLAQDLIYVGGGSLVSLLGVWRAHGIDEILREAWEAGSSSAASAPARCAGSPTR